MRIPIWLTGITAIIVTGIVIFIGTEFLEPELPLLDRVDSSVDIITPNADGDRDITEIHYRINRDSIVSIRFEDANGRVFTFRDRRIRPQSEYRVGFGGVVDGYVLPDETIQGEVIRRLIPDGIYTWTVEAEAQDDGEVMSFSGTLEVRDADSPLPEMTEFTVFPDVFTPNQDGVDDRTQVNIFLMKDADLQVYLVNNEGERVFMARRDEGREAGEAGRQMFDYEGGVDIGADPPEDGLYTIVAVAQDDEGQVVQRTAQLTIEDGGKPRAEISAQPIGATVVFETIPYDDRYYNDIDNQGALVDPPESVEGLNQLPISMTIGDMLVFRLTVENYGAAPIRTTGPFPGTVYQQNQIASSLGAFQSSGAWRVGIQCETSTESYPWRWAIGTPDVELYTEVAPDGEVFYYLPPNESAVVWGAIRMTDILDAQNPQRCWAGLIHEDVEVTLQNQNVGPREVLLEDPNAGLED